MLRIVDIIHSYTNSIDPFFSIWIAIAAVAFGSWAWNHFSSKSPSFDVSKCPNPNCIRCQRYDAVQKTARRRLPWVAKEVGQKFPGSSLERVTQSVQQHTTSDLKGQAPVVLFVRGLSVHTNVTHLHKDAVDTLEASSVRQGILDDLALYSKRWLDNDAAGWQVLHLLNQGQWMEETVRQCPNLTRLIKGFGDLLDSSLFGNAFVSKIRPGTVIEPHCGPTNVRHRLQYPLIFPVATARESVGLKVLNETISWKQAFVFDDSLVHSVDYSKGLTERVVLIVDLWHPELSLAERELVSQLYSAAKSSSASI